jgi:hypothetical protein
MSTFVKKVISGSAEILASGTIISFDGSPLEFHLGSTEIPLILKLNFFKDDTGKVRGEPRLEEANVLSVSLYNFQLGLGGGLISPINIGVWANKELFFSFRVFPLNGSDQTTMVYSFYTK